MSDSLATRIKDELNDVVDAYLKEDSLQKMEQDEKGEEFLSGRGLATVPGEKRVIILGLAMRMPNDIIVKGINEIREKAGLPLRPAKFSLFYYRKRYDKIIDEIYTLVAVRVGEIYPLADKLTRIARLNELGEVLHNEVYHDFKAKVYNDMSIKMGNLLVKILDRLSSEMGGKTLQDMMVRRLPKEREDEESPDEIVVSKDTLKEFLTEAIQERYSGQLPQSISQKIEFTDYVNCANGETMGEICACFNDKMTNDSPGSRCKIQSGELKICPKFLNRILLSNKEWLTQARTKGGQSIYQLSSLLGCTDYDDDIRRRIVYFLKKYDIVGDTAKYLRDKMKKNGKEIDIDLTPEEKEEIDGQSIGSSELVASEEGNQGGQTSNPRGIDSTEGSILENQENNKSST